MTKCLFSKVLGEVLLPEGSLFYDRIDSSSSLGFGLLSYEDLVVGEGNWLIGQDE